MRSLAVAVVLAAVLPACTLYFHQENADDVACTGSGYGDEGAPRPTIPERELRNPETGQCEAQYTYPSCNPDCGPCPIYDTAASPDWAYCDTQCDSLDESTCKDTSGCQAAYAGDPTADQPPQFLGCWATAPSGPVEGGGCLQLGAYECSRHDDCSPLHSQDFLGTRGAPIPPIYSTFVSCMNETPAEMSCTDVDCDLGTHCETQCTDHCNPGGDCSSTCGATCVPDAPPPTACDDATDAMSCSALSGCQPVYQGDDCTCYPGYCTCQVLTYDHCESLLD